MPEHGTVGEYPGVILGAHRLRGGFRTGVGHGIGQHGGHGSAEADGSGAYRASGSGVLVYEPGRDYGDLDILLVRREGGSEDDVRAGVDDLLDDLASLVDLAQHHVFAAGDIEYDAGRPLDIRLEQRTVNGVAHGVYDALLALAVTYAHVREPALFEHGFDIGEVEIDMRGIGDDIADPLHALAQHIVGDLEGALEADLAVKHLDELLIGDDEQRIHEIAQITDARLGVRHARRALKIEGLGDHGDGEDAHGLGYLRDDGSRAGAGAAAHARGDEQKIDAFKSLLDLLAGLLGSHLADLGI